MWREEWKNRIFSGFAWCSLSVCRHSETWWPQLKFSIEALRDIPALGTTVEAYDILLVEQCINNLE